MKQLLISSLLTASLFVPAIQAETPAPAFKDYAVTDLFQEKATRLLQNPEPRFEYELLQALGSQSILRVSMPSQSGAAGRAVKLVR